MAFIFYDVETTGADRSFDQILQFAAVLTDDDFNTLEEFEIRSRLLPHIVPSPRAMQVTRVSVDQLHDLRSPSHFEMCKQIREVMTRWSPATIVGYNSLSFDEEMLRRAFYSSLLPIYLTNTGGNSRLDVLTLIAAVHAFAPATIDWPINEKGKASFKLDRLAPDNGFEHVDAHDALADVHATIYLARLVRDRAPAVWNPAMVFRKKVAATEYVEEQPVFVATRLRFGVHFCSLVTALGLNPDNSGEMFVLDLQQDPASIAAMTDDELAEYVVTKPRPIMSIKLNACPIFMPIEIAGPSAAGYGLGMDELQRRAAVVRGDRGFRLRLIGAVRAVRKPFPESTHVEERIYSGFYSRSDDALIDEFHQSGWPRRFELCSVFADARLRTLARRLVYCEAPSIMPPEIEAAYGDAIATRIHTRTEATGRWTTYDDAIEDARKLLENETAQPCALIQAHHAHLVTRRHEIGRRFQSRQSVAG